MAEVSFRVELVSSSGGEACVCGALGAQPFSMLFVPRGSEDAHGFGWEVAAARVLGRMQARAHLACGAAASVLGRCLFSPGQSLVRLTQVHP